MAAQKAPDWDAELQVYEPHRAGLPAMRPYFRDLMGRMPFAAQFSKSGIKAAHTETVFGQAWLIINPLLLAAVYYFVVAVIGGRTGFEFFAHICGGIFVFSFVSAAISSGAGSVTGGGRLILNMAFPRLLMPLAAVRTSFFRFLPTIPVFLVINALAGAPWSFTMLLGLVFLALLMIFAFGMAAFFAAVQVYFRDTTSFLPYFLRIWLYVSPVLWFPEDIGARIEGLEPWMILNPLYSLVGGWSDLVLRAQVPDLKVWVAALAWALAALVGGSLYFMSRERDFAVRL